MEYIIYRSQRKTLAIHITKDAKIEVRAPLKVPQSVIENFVLQKRQWIDDTLKKAMERVNSRSNFTIEDGKQLYYRGKPCSVIVNHDKAITFKEDTFFIPNYDEVRKKTMLIKWYKKEAKVYLAAKVEHLSMQTGIKYSSVKIGSAHTRWGSCSTKGNLNFTYKLMMLSDVLIDYVVIHELSHIIEHNHSKAFWKVVEGFLPDYKRRQKDLKQYQVKLAFWE